MCRSDRDRHRHVLGHFYPKAGAAMKPLGDGFIALIKMMIAPVIFCTVVHGIASMSDLTKVGRIGLKTLLYFEVISTLALAIGLVIGELVHPGSGFNIDASALDPNSVKSYVQGAKGESVVAHLQAIIPNSFFGALANGALLQVLLVSILSGFAISRLRELGARIASVIDAAAKVFFRIIGFIVHLAPLGAFGAMAFTSASMAWARC
jgi:aerobic C4-dicarboxylate transport protein